MFSKQMRTRLKDTCNERRSLRAASSLHSSPLKRGRTLPVMATWIIRSKTSTWRRTKFFPAACKQRRVGVQSARRHRNLMLERRYAHVMEKFLVCLVWLTHLRRLKNSCWDALSSRLTHWTKPLRTSLPLVTLADLGKSKSQLIAENALLRQQLIVLRRQVKRPTFTRTDRILLVLL